MLKVSLYYKDHYLGLSLTAPFVAEDREVMFGLDLVFGFVFRFGEFYAMAGGGANASMYFLNGELFYRPPIDMNGIWKIAPEVGMGVTSYRPFDSEDRVEPLWMNYADFAGVKCDIRFGLYL